MDQPSPFSPEPVFVHFTGSGQREPKQPEGWQRLVTPKGSVLFDPSAADPALIGDLAKTGNEHLLNSNPYAVATYGKRMGSFLLPSLQTAVGSGPAISPPAILPPPIGASPYPQPAPAMGTGAFLPCSGLGEPLSGLGGAAAPLYDPYDPYPPFGGYFGPPAG